MSIQDTNELFSRKNYIYQNQTYPSGFIFDYWSCSSSEKTPIGHEKLAGAYPAGFLKRWRYAFFNSLPAEAKILHVCSGRLPKRKNEWRLDLDKEFEPDFLMNAENFHEKIPSEFLNFFDWTLSDSPYNEEASQKYYNKPLLNKRKMLNGMIAVTKIGGMIGVLDQSMPSQVGLKNIKAVAKVAVSSIPNLDLRIFSVYQKISE